MSDRLDRTRRNPAGDWTIRDVEAVCREHAVLCEPVRDGGSHHKVAHRQMAEKLTSETSRQGEVTMHETEKLSDVPRRRIAARLERARKVLVAAGICGAIAACNEAPVASSKQPPAQPVSEAEFVRVLTIGRERVRAAEKNHDELEEKELWEKRTADLCKLIGPTVSDWTGTVVVAGTKEEGFAFLEVGIARRISVLTQDHRVMAKEYDTVIEQSSPLFAIVRRLKGGDEVRFTGQFLRDDDTCLMLKYKGYRWASLDDFVFRFSAVATIN